MNRSKIGSSDLSIFLQTAESTESQQIIDSPVGDNEIGNFGPSSDSAHKKVRSKEGSEFVAKDGSNGGNLNLKLNEDLGLSCSSVTQLSFRTSYETPPVKFNDVREVWQSNHDDRVEAVIDKEKFTTQEFKAMKCGGIPYKVMNCVLNLLIKIFCSPTAMVVIPSHLSTEWFSLNKFEVEDGKVYLDKCFVTAILVCGGAKSKELDHWILLWKCERGFFHVYDPAGFEKVHIKQLYRDFKLFRYKCYGQYFDDHWKWLDEVHPNQQDSYSCGLLCLAAFEAWLHLPYQIVETDAETCLQLRINALNSLLKHTFVSEVRGFCLFCQNLIQFQDWLQCCKCERRVHLTCQQGLPNRPYSQSIYCCRSCGKLLAFQS